MRGEVKYITTALLIAVFLTMPVAVPLFKSSTPYSVFNTNWNGLSKFAMLARSEGHEVKPIFQPFDMIELHKLSGVLVIVGPNVTFTRDEIAEIRAFLQAGNTLFIADDFGTGNEILRGLNVPVGISNYPLHDFFYLEDDRFIVSVRIASPILARNVTEVVTDEPSAVIVTHKGEAYVSRMAMINFHRREYPLLTELSYGRGRIIVLADPDVLTNELYTRNKPFIKNLVGYLGGGTFYVDEAHHPDFDLYTAGTVAVTRILPRGRAVKLIALVGIALILFETRSLRILLSLLSSLLQNKPMESVEKLVIRLAGERGWDEEEVVEMIERMGD
ncbi:DUF4350 domain-containing protein [Thermococcus sp.]